MDKRDRAAIGGSNYMHTWMHASDPFISWPFTALLPVALSHHSHPIPVTSPSIHPSIGLDLDLDLVLSRAANVEEA